MATDQQHFFSTGQIRIGTQGNTALTDSDNLVYDIQDVTFDLPYNAKELYTDAQTAVFAVAVGFHQGKPALKIGTKDFDRIFFEYLLGLTAVTTSGVDVFTITATTAPALCRVEFLGTDQNGKTMLIVFTNAYAPGLSTKFNLDDFSDTSFELYAMCDPNAAVANSVGTIAMVQ